MIELKMGSDGFTIDGCQTRNTSRGINGNDVITVIVRRHTAVDHTMAIQIHSAEDNPQNEAGTGVITIEDSLLYGGNNASELAHPIYLSGGLGGICNVLRNRILGFVGDGHGIKFGCSAGLVEGNLVDPVNGSVALDLVTGGDITVQDNVFKSNELSNANMATVAVSSRRERGGVWNPPSNVVFKNNLWQHTRAGDTCVIFSQSNGTITIDGDVTEGVNGGCQKIPSIWGYSRVWNGLLKEERQNSPNLALEDTPGFTIINAIRLEPNR